MGSEYTKGTTCSQSRAHVPEHDNGNAHFQQIRRSHASARPKHDNPAWLHTHNDLTFVLERYDTLRAIAVKMLFAIEQGHLRDLAVLANDIRAELASSNPLPPKAE